MPKLYEIINVIDGVEFRLVDLLTEFHLPNGRRDAINTDKKWLEKVAERLNFSTDYCFFVREVSDAV